MSQKIIQFNEDVVKQQLGTLVRESVEATLNTLLDEEADRLTNAQRYERTESRTDTRAGHYKRHLLTKAGDVELKIPKLRKLTFETAIIQRYQKRESSVEEALVEMYLAGVSVLTYDLNH
jgi:transposase-like protein